jgi:spermidine synthase
MKNGIIYLIVTVSGASVLALEILGTRILGPFYGVGLFLWSALISVTLAALSLGYAVGGRWADRGPKLTRLCMLLLLAGLWVLAIPWLKRPVLLIAEPFGLRFAVLVAATILFFPPLALLGMVSPYAIRLKASGIEVVGRTAGNLYAVSTIASVVAALLTGFFLIPNMGISRLTVSIGLILVGTSLIGIAGKQKQIAGFIILIFTAAAVTGACILIPYAQSDPANGILSVEQSPYSEIRVVDVNSQRYLLIDGVGHTIVDLETGRALCEYVNVLDIAKSYFNEPGTMLLLGLGGGSVVKHYARDGWQIDAVEIDPCVTKAAYNYFELEPSEATVYHADGRAFLNSCDRLYDLIIMDAFGSSSIPFQLVTREAFALIASKLTSAGVLAVNMESIGWHDKIVYSLAASIELSFDHVLALPIAEPPNSLDNLILLASNRSLELTEEKEPPVPIDRKTANYDRFHAWENRFRPDTQDALILTDEHNPIDLWAEAINVQARSEFHDYFKNSGVDW